MTATTEPSRVTAGDTVTWLKSLADYPASAGWVLVYTLINAAAKQTITATASGDDHLVTVSAATSAGWAAGSYTWSARVSKASEKFTIGTGSILVAPDLAASATFDTRSSARKALEAVNTALEGYGAKAYLQSFEIAGRKQAFNSPSEFMAFRSRLMAEVAREDNATRLAAGLAPRNQLAVRFNSR
ncbi:hypothetical protein MCEMIEM13_01520 [Comamonadaceae bacterium]